MPAQAPPTSSPSGACEALRRADVVLYDRLTHPALLDHAPAHAERVYCGRAPGAPGDDRQETIHDLMVRHARAGRIVVRLKGGDPFVFGRGGEEMLALAEAGVAFEVVPGRHVVHRRAGHGGHSR